MDSSHKTHAAFGLLAGFVLLALFGAQLSGPGITLNRDRNWISDYGGNPADGADGSDDAAFSALLAARIAVQQYDAFLPPGVWNISDLSQRCEGHEHTGDRNDFQFQHRHQCGFPGTGQYGGLGPAGRVAAVTE